MKRYSLSDECTFRLGKNGALSFWSPADAKNHAISIRELDVLVSLASGLERSSAVRPVQHDGDAGRTVDWLLKSGLLKTASGSEGAGTARRSSKEVLPVFVLGAPRSGTTLVRWILDTHSRIHCPGETRFLLALRDFFESPHTAPNLAALGITETRLLEHLRALVLAIMGDLTAKAGKARWAEKTPYYSILPNFIYRLFDGKCQFILVIRHAVDAAISMVSALEEKLWSPGLRMAHETDQQFGLTDIPLLRAARIWSSYCEHLDAFRRVYPKSCLVIHYEKLVAHPKSVATRIFEFVGEKMERGLLDLVFRSDHGNGRGDPKIRRDHSIEDRSGAWRRLPSGMLKAVSPIVNPQLAVWGYPTIR
jgi:protein-tyrosine sulfotransferase